jgi:hypothetical protein
VPIFDRNRVFFKPALYIIRCARIDADRKFGGCHCGVLALMLMIIDAQTLD